MQPECLNAGSKTPGCRMIFKATGITNFLENGGTLEVAQRIAGHADNECGFPSSVKCPPATRSKSKATVY
jgi:hypothetical protein